MKIKAGCYYITRGGKKAFVAGVREVAKESQDCAVGWIEGGELETWCISGKWVLTANGDHRDLIEEWKDPLTRILTVYMYQNGLTIIKVGDEEPCEGYVASKKVTLIEGEFAE